MEKRDLEVISVSITNRFGAAYEESKIKGISHFMEHMVFTGTKSRSSEEISKEVEKKGGILNAFTSKEITSFWFKLPSEHLISGLDILSDILINPAFDEAKFQKEKKVIAEEIKMNKDHVQRYIYDLIESALYEKPFGEGVLGSVETLGALKRDFVFDYFNNNYSPSNYIVSIVGNADFEKICNYLEEKFKGKSERIDEKKIVKKNQRIVEQREGIDQAHLVFAVHAPLFLSKEFYAFELIDAYLTSGMSSKLFLKIREEKGLAYTVRGSFAAEKNYSYYSIYVGTKKDSVKEVEEIIIDEFRKIKDMTEEELEEAKERVIGLRKLASEDSSNVMTDLTFCELSGDVSKYYSYEKNIREITLKDIKKLSDIRDFSVAVILPK
jgi:predicted Zn-dependent peptidase